MEKNHIKIACLGDSITYGENLIHRALSCYPAQLQNMLGKGYEVRNYGRNGSEREILHYDRADRVCFTPDGIRIAAWNTGSNEICIFGPFSWGY